MRGNIRLVSDSELGSFSWRWPETTERFERGYAALVRFEGGEFRIRHGIGRRTVYGRPRLHSVTWVDNRPTVEGVEADVVCRCPIPDPKMLRSTICSGSFSFG